MWPCETDDDDGEVVQGAGGSDRDQEALLSEARREAVAVRAVREALRRAVGLEGARQGLRHSRVPLRLRHPLHQVLTAHFLPWIYHGCPHLISRLISLVLIFILAPTKAKCRSCAGMLDFLLFLEQISVHVLFFFFFFTHDDLDSCVYLCTF
jgi:hypothetical protein